MSFVCLVLIEPSRPLVSLSLTGQVALGGM